MSTSAQLAGRKAENSEWLDHAVRIGMVAYGIVHLMVGFLAVQLALGSGGKSASQKGALAELAQQPFGKVLVWAIAIGMVLLVVWRVLDAAFGHQEKTGADKLKAQRRLGVQGRDLRGARVHGAEDRDRLAEPGRRLGDDDGQGVRAGRPAS